VTADEADRPSIVVRDKRRVGADGTRTQGSGSAAKAAGPGPESTAPSAETKEPSAPSDETKTEDKAMNDAKNESTEAEPEVVEMTISPADEETEESAEAPAAGEGKSRGAAKGGTSRGGSAGGDEDGNTGAPVYAELGKLRTELDDLTSHLQRVTAEYANYRKRVDRDRAQAGEAATGVVVGALLPVLDDLDRAREHGDLVGPFGAVADQLSAALGKFGLEAFGEPGDPFDPTVHEAVSHKSSPDVTETTCVEIMRRGYMLGDRLLRPALVGVADPE